MKLPINPAGILIPATTYLKIHIRGGTPTPMNDLQKRREDLMGLIRHPEHQAKVINYLKNLKGIPANEPLPNGTPIISEIIRLEIEQARSEATA